MASIEKDPGSGVYRIRFRYGGRHFMRSLKTKDAREADALRARADENLRLIERGRLELPDGADVGLFVLSDGKVDRKATLPRAVTLGELFRLYAEHFTSEAKEANTRDVERIHAAHVKRLIGAAMSLSQVTAGVLQAYVDARAKERWRGRAINPLTIRKELATLRSVWAWAHRLGHTAVPVPGRGLTFPKGREKPPFQTYDEVAAVVARGGLSRDSERNLWDGVFLDVAQIAEVLDCVRTHTSLPWLHPLVATAAYTGARRSELLRSHVEDFNFASGTVLVREKKKRKERETFRVVDMAPQLAGVMKRYISASHPGGAFAFCSTPGGPIRAGTAAKAFRRAVKRSKWKVLRGYHVFRHSFSSNLAAAGVDQRVIDELMGHQTEAMRSRYRHLFPAQRRQAVASVFGGAG
jgi:integrase